jgi:hypothetical protein
MKSLSLTALLTCALLAGFAEPDGFDARLSAAAEQDRRYELPPRGTRVNRTKLGGIRRRDGRKSRIIAAASGQVCELNQFGVHSNLVVPYGDGYRGPINLALPSLSGDPSNPNPAVLTAPGEAGDRPLVLYDFSQSPVRLGEVPGGTLGPGGLNLTSGDISGDATHEIFVTGGPDGSNIRVIDTGRDDDLIFDPRFETVDDFNARAVLRLAAGDLDGNGRAELIVGHPVSGEVKVFEFLNGRDPNEVGFGFPFGVSPSGGVFVAAGDVNNDGTIDLITGAGDSSHVRVFDVSGAPEVLGDFFAFPPELAGGVRVSAGLIDGDPVVAAVSGPHIRMMRPSPDESWTPDAGFAPNPFGQDPNAVINVQFFTPR